MVKNLLIAAAAVAAVAAASLPAAAQTPGQSILFSSKQGDLKFPFTPPTASVAGTIDNMVIGSGTPRGGSFTSLSSTQAPTGAGITALFASPPALGGTAAAAGKFTTLNASGQITSTAGAPAIASGNCGTGTNGSVAGTNQSGAITIGASATTTCQVDFSATLAAAPNACVIFPANATAAAAGTTVARVSAITTAHFIVTGSALASANYYFICL
ncbi:MAG TPA: hypothetical protein VIU44_08085 [Gaiellaceae bacterium]